MLAETGGICPVTRCPKGLVNGPCGGIKDGKCETDPDVDCVWILIYNRLKERGGLDSLKKLRPPKDNSKHRKPQEWVVK
jgi:methylene-tetrahydrofolate reductase-like protein